MTDKKSKGNSKSKGPGSLRHEVQFTGVLLCLEEVFDGDGEVAEAFAGGVVDGVGDGWGYAGEADFADASGTVFAHDWVGVVEEDYFDFGAVGVGGD